MFARSLVALALAATGLAQVEMPEGYRTVYITSNVDTNYVITAPSLTEGGALVVQTLNEGPEQQWWIQAEETKIQLAGTNLCIDAGPQSNWVDMATINTAICDDTVEGQQFFRMEDNRMAIALSSGEQECIDLQYMRATPGNPVGMYSCAGLGTPGMVGAEDAGLNWPLVDVEAP